MKIKYMGTSDNRVLKKGEDFGGQLAEPLPKDVIWSVGNNHLVDSEEAGLSDEACELLLDLQGTVYGEANLVEPEESTARNIKEFKDVTTMKVIPPSLHQATYLGLKGIKNKAVTDDEDVPEPDEDPSGSEQTPGEKQTAKRAKSQTSGGGAGGGGGAPAVGGSTDGAGGQTTSSGTTSGSGTGDTTTTT